MTIRIVTDSACDLPDHLAAELGITVVPLSIRFGSEEFVDRRDLSPKEFWRRVADSPVLPETAAPSPGQFEAAFREAADAGCDGVVCINLSSKLSATIGSAQLAATAVHDRIPVHVIDSLSITSGQGSMCVEAAKAAANGHDATSIAATVRSMIGRTRVYGALDTLDNLKKGGRIGGAQAFLGSLLQVKPLIDVSTGEVHQLGKQRTRAKALAHLGELAVKARNEHGRIDNLAVMHGDASDIDELLGPLRAAFPGQEILVGQIGAVIGAHGGPRVVGLTFTIPAAP